MAKQRMTSLVMNLLNLPVAGTALGLSQTGKKKVLQAMKTTMNILRRKQS